MDIVKAREELLFGKTIYDMKLRVADYGRVSTDKNDQINSLENQTKYFNDFIDGIKNWTHVNSYKDEGISGTQVNKREEFLKMIEDAKNNKIDLIVTKEVSRFARNTIDSIHYTELLLKHGVIVFFISDNINTIYKDSEFRLTLMASMAQDEVRKLSERVKFGIKRSIKDGKVGGSSLYGYKKNNCRLEIIPSEAKVVKLIYSLYAEGEYGLKKIGEILSNKKIYTRKGNIFSDATLKKMIKNPRYKGWYTANLSEIEDYKTHKKKYKKENEWIMYKDTKGVVPKIVNEEVWERANNLLKKRNSVWNRNVINKEKYLDKNSYTSKIICYEHNKSFIKSSSSKRINNPIWSCNEYLRHGLKGCESPIISEKKIDEIFTNVFEKIIDKEKLIEIVLHDYITLIKENENNDRREYEKIIEERRTFKDRLINLLLRKIISEEEYFDKINEIENEIKKISNKSDDFFNIIANINNKINSIVNNKNIVRKYFNIFIDKVYVSKICNERKHLNLKIIFKYLRDDLNLEIYI